MMHKIQNRFIQFRDLVSTYSIFVLVFSSGLIVFLLTTGDILLKILVGLSISYSLLSLFFHPNISIKSDPFHPLVLIKIMLILGYLIGLIGIYQHSYLRDGIPILVAFVGIFFIMSADVIAYVFESISIFKNIKFLNHNFHQNYSNIKYILLLLYIISWVWRLFSFKSGLLQGTFLASQLKVSPSSNIIGVLNNSGYIFYVGLIIISTKISYAILPFEILWGFITGSKSIIIYAIFPILFVNFKKRRLKFNKKFFLTAFLGLIIFLISFSAIYLYRIQSNLLISKYGVENLSVSKVVKNMDIKKIQYEEISSLIFYRFNLALPFAVLINTVHYNNIDLWKGKSLLPIISWYVPRAVWQDKYKVSIGNWYAQEAYGWGLNSSTEVGTTIMGDGYLNFGLSGSILFPIIWFILIILIYSLGIKLNFWSFWFLSTIYLKLILSIEQNFAVPFVSLMQSLTLFILIVIAVSLIARVMPIGIKNES